MTMAPSPALFAMHDKLREAASRIDVDPQTNSVFALARSTFLDLEKGAVSLGELETVIDEIHLRFADARADFIRAQHSGGKTDVVWAGVEQSLKDATTDGLAAFKAAVETPKGGIVFTAHPTFALSTDIRSALADHVRRPDEQTLSALGETTSADSRDWSSSITLNSEHDEVQTALHEAQAAMSVYASLVVKVARAAFPDDWQDLKPALPTLASWVGYDLDGRTDIDWWHSVAFRLSEKAAQLGRYAERLEAICDNADAAVLVSRLKRASLLAQTEADLFGEDLSDDGALVSAVKQLTTDHDDRIVDAGEILSGMEGLMSQVDADTRATLVAFRAEVEALQLGTARVHLRVNAAQVRAVIRRDLGLETEDRDLGRLALEQLTSKASSDAGLTINFADLVQEQSTARRQIMMCAIWLKYIDSGSPIRFLIAEVENPATVMGAVYLARQYGIADKLDISPLFETPEALETGGRFIQRLLQEKAFVAYVKSRGYLSIQLGFSDAGRFIGQIAANMAIERIHNLVIQSLADIDEGLGLLIFNTHGESFGRGAWPGPFKERLDYALTCWTRGEAQRLNVPLQHEVSFQGGDGFLHFANAELAETAYGAFCSHLLAVPDDCSDDPFYAERSFTWDIYRALRTWHEALFNDEDYGELLSSFATNFQVRAGSRQKRRTGGPKGPRALRAISHNATLQQMGAPVNSAAGLGAAVRRERERLIDLLDRSSRMRQLMNLALRARTLTTLPALRAYGRVYDPGFWVAISGVNEAESSVAYRRVYYRLASQPTYQSINTVANRFAIDLGKFDTLIGMLSDAPSAEERHEDRLDLHVLHAIRQAMMMQAFSLAGRLPSLSRRFEAETSDFMGQVLSMDLADATEMLSRAFPASAGSNELYLKLGGSPDDQANRGYEEVNTQVIDPLKQIQKLLHKTTLAISHAYGAYG